MSWQASRRGLTNTSANGPELHDHVFLQPKSTGSDHPEEQETGPANGNPGEIANDLARIANVFREP
jgi:hypothetical protein